MKNSTIIALLIFISGLSYGQNFDDIMTKKKMDCSDISFNSGLHFIRYMQENKFDSAKKILQYWESKCGMREPIYRAKVLLAIKQNQFNDTLLTNGTLRNIFNYQNRMEMIKHSNYYSYDNYKSYYGFIPPGQEFDKYTQELSKTLIQKYEPNQIEFLLTEFYGENSDAIFSKIQTKKYGQSNLITEYDEAINKYTNMAELHISWVTGVWIPTGELKKLGTHPELGFQIGAKHKKMNYDLIMTFKFVNSPNDYYARRTKADNSLELTNHFFGGHIGLDLGRDIYTRNGHEFQLTGGVAFDGFDALKENQKNDFESETTWTYNFSFGLGYRYYIKNTFYLGLRAKYNIVDYSLNNVVDFTGNPITIQLVIGSVNNRLRNDNLKALKHKLRK